MTEGFVASSYYDISSPTGQAMRYKRLNILEVPVVVKVTM
jgi:hypothetical protein